MPARELEVLEAAGDLAERVRRDLAVLGGQVRGELLAVRLDEVPDLEHDVGALRERRRAPGRERGLGRRDGRRRPPRPRRSRRACVSGRSPGRRPAPSRPDVPATLRPPIQWLTRPGAGASDRAAPGSATCVMGRPLVAGRRVRRPAGVGPPRYSVAPSAGRRPASGPRPRLDRVGAAGSGQLGGRVAGARVCGAPARRRRGRDRDDREPTGDAERDQRRRH